MEEKVPNVDSVILGFCMLLVVFKHRYLKCLCCIYMKLIDPRCIPASKNVLMFADGFLDVLSLMFLNVGQTLHTKLYFR